MDDEISGDDCGDFSFFKRKLQESRKFEDTIQIQLNKANNDPQKCRSIWESIQDASQSRKRQILRCVDYYEPMIMHLQLLALADPPTSTTRDALKQLQLRRSELDLLRTELTVEDIVQQNTLKVFKRKCSSFHPAHITPNPSGSPLLPKDQV
eukprot:TRINITY_DN432_c0_g1_i2.p2 TRINITY_DN432_c0_g1~~TRINITY_DN432_c0_g1_i2.p2  ORF type:complete len:152 (+),score=23.71 TRINITY_DN432_c0_g1_i2:37-492(+)